MCPTSVAAVCSRFRQSVRVTDEPLAILERLIDGWCERRTLRVLATVLPAYTSLNGLTDGCADLVDALRTVRADGDLPAEEAAAVERVVIAVENALHGR
jgi:hypothetical protein